MKKYLSILLLLVIQFGLSAQETATVQTEIKAENVFDLSIIQVYPDSFPAVSVVFQAKNKFNKPLWKLNRSELTITENDKNCEVVRLINITENKPLNIGLVFDHSGSMVENPSLTPDSIKQWGMQDWYFSGIPLPEGYVMAIDYAKEGVLGFLTETENTDDSIMFCGFSTQVDHVLPLTNDMSSMKTFVDSVLPGGMTSFYDALYLTIDSLSGKNNAAVVALTDGQDNMSAKNYQDVIDYAIEKNIAVYIIGLGNVSEFEAPLKQIADKTGGFYYYTNDPKKLVEIYLNIKDQLKSIYQVDYLSSIDEYSQHEQTINFRFVNDTLQFNNNDAYYSLPDEALTYLKEQEEKRLAEFRNKVILAIGIGGIALLGLGAFVLYRRKKKNKLFLKKVYPNPFNKEINVEFSIPGIVISPVMNIYDSSGFLIMSQPVPMGESSIKLNLENLEKGFYIIEIIAEGAKSNPIKIIKNNS